MAGGAHPRSLGTARTVVPETLLPIGVRGVRWAAGPGGRSLWFGLCRANRHRGHGATQDANSRSVDPSTWMRFAAFQERQCRTGDGGVAELCGDREGYLRQACGRNGGWSRVPGAVGGRPENRLVFRSSRQSPRPREICTPWYPRSGCLQLCRGLGRARRSPGCARGDLRGQFHGGP